MPIFLKNDSAVVAEVPKQLIQFRDAWGRMVFCSPQHHVHVQDDAGNQWSVPKKQFENLFGPFPQNNEVK